MNVALGQERGRNLALLTVMLAFVLDVADSTIVNTALPAIQKDLGSSHAEAQWYVAGYFLSFSIFLVTGGRLGDLLGYRRLFLAGVTAFTLASAGCGLSQSPIQLVVWRLAQGVAAAMMGPQVMAIVQLLFSPVERIAKLAWFGTLGGMAAILGPILGGLLISADVAGLGWRSVFLINLPIGLIALVMGLRFLPSERSATAEGVDLVGTALLGLALTALLVPMVEGPSSGWPLWTILSLAAAIALGAANVAYARIKRRAGGSPLIEPSLFHERTFSLGLLASLCFSAGVSGFVLVFALSYQMAGHSPLDTALMLVPFGLGVSTGIAILGRRLLPRAGKWVPVAGAGGMGAICATLLLLIAFGDAPALLMLVMLGAGGLCMGMAAGPLTPIALSRVERSHAGTASGMLKAAQQVGGALGAALVGGAYFSGGGTALAALVLGGVLGSSALFSLCLPPRLFAPAPV